ncbi:hypothetical protein P9112_006504 [Eukaryota sp. TZLM1-RC]
MSRPPDGLSFPPRIRQLLNAYFKAASRTRLNVVEYPDLTLVSVAGKGSAAEKSSLYRRLLELQKNLRCGVSPFPLGYETLFTALSRPINQETGSSIFVLPGNVRITSPSEPSFELAQSAVAFRAGQINCQTRAHVLWIHVGNNSPRRFKFEPHPHVPDDLRLVSLPTTNNDVATTTFDPIIVHGAHINSLIVIADINDPGHMEKVLNSSFNLADSWDENVISRSVNKDSAIRQPRVTDGSCSLSSRVQHLMFYVRKDEEKGNVNSTTKSSLMRHDISASELVHLLQKRTVDYTIKHPHPSEFNGMIGAGNGGNNSSKRIFGLGYIANVLRKSTGNQENIDSSDRVFSRIQHWFSMDPKSGHIEDSAVVLPCRPNVAMDLILPHSYGIGSLQIRFHFNTRLPSVESPIGSLSSFVSEVHDELSNAMKENSKSCFFKPEDLCVSQHSEPLTDVTTAKGKVPLPPHVLLDTFSSFVENRCDVIFPPQNCPHPRSASTRIHKSMANAWKDVSCDWLLETRDVCLNEDNGLVLMHITNTNSGDQRQESALFTRLWDNFWPLSSVEADRLSNYVTIGSSENIGRIMSSPAKPFAGSQSEILSPNGILDLQEFLHDTMNVLSQHYHHKENATLRKKVQDSRSKDFTSCEEHNSLFYW